MIDELYDLSVDPYELENKINHPDYEEIKNKMMGFLSEWQDKTGDFEVDGNLISINGKE